MSAPDPLSEPLSSPPSRRAIYLLPNLLTTAALLFGFYAIIAAWRGDLSAAAISLFVAILFDGLDGRIARLTHTQSSFGAHYDSLSDMVSFGIAPALLAHAAALSTLGQLGWTIGFIYAAAAALRLARFNATLATSPRNYFQGLPTPAAAALIASIIWLAVDLSWSPNARTLVTVLATLLAAVAMVSNILYWSGKTLDPRRSVPFLAAAGVALLFALIAFYPPGVFSALTLLYVLSGPLIALFRRLRKHRPPSPFDASPPKSPPPSHPSSP
ncbi:MAG: CDP-diacylglycerol--serine O-phosphatidyltransferase [Hydrogenophilus sp.]|nr:CDP-diacylglycerol--serine O-phosphatidyltransferase [Hydrogenophilus sp.]